MLIILIKNNQVVQGNLQELKLTFEPGEPGSGYEFINKIKGGNIPTEYIPGVQKGLDSSTTKWSNGWFPMY